MSDIDLIECEFDEYLRDSSARYGLVIDGEWGSGKTHFFDARLRPKVVAARMKVLYVSAFGISQKDDLRLALLYAAHPILKSGAAEVVGSLLMSFARSLGGTIELVGKLEARIGKDVLICVDDLERADPEALISLLGILNLYVEHKKCKLLVLCDEGRVSSNAQDIRTQYLEWREKLIGRSYRFHPSVERQCSVAVEIVGADLQTRGWLTSNRATAFQEIAQIADCRNLRALCHALTSYARFNTTREAAEIEFTEEREVVAFATIVALSLVFAKSKVRAERLWPLFRDQSYMELWRAVRANEQDIDEFRAKYGGPTGKNLLTIPSAYRIVVEGLISPTDLKSELLELYPDGEISAFDIVTTASSKVDDATFSKALDETVRMLHDGEVTKLEQIARLSYALFFLAERGVLKISQDDLKAAFLFAIELAEKAPNFVRDDSITTGTYDAAFPNPVGEDHVQVVASLKRSMEFRARMKYENEKSSLFELLSAGRIAEFATALHSTSSLVRSASLFEPKSARPIIDAISRAIAKGPESGGPDVSTLCDAIRTRYLQSPELMRSEWQFVFEFARLLREIHQGPEFRRNFPKSSLSMDSIIALADAENARQTGAQSSVPT